MFDIKWIRDNPEAFDEGLKKRGLKPGGDVMFAAELAKLDDGKNVRFLDIAAAFYGQDGKIPFALMPDQLHPNAAGYQLWADAMKPLLTQMLK